MFKCPECEYDLDSLYYSTRIIESGDFCLEESFNKRYKETMETLFKCHHCDAILATSLEEAKSLLKGEG